MRILVTGGLGLIGHNVLPRLHAQRHTVVSVDTLTDYGIIPHAELDYLVNERRKKVPDEIVNFETDICDARAMDNLFMSFRPDAVLHLASFPRQKVVNANPAWGSRVN